jgi:thiaminase
LQQSPLGSPGDAAQDGFIDMPRPSRGKEDPMTMNPADRSLSLPISASSSSSSSRLPRDSEERRRAALAGGFVPDAIARCERAFDASPFFQRLGTGELTPEQLRYVFGQYGHFRLQLHRWFGLCISKASNSAEPAERQAILALADHIFTDLRDDHDQMFREYLHQLGFPSWTLHGEPVSEATRAYVGSFFDDCGASSCSFFEAIAALGGRELSVALRNRRLLELYFGPRGLNAPAWISLHAELEVEHFVDVIEPFVARDGNGSAQLRAARGAIGRAVGRHVGYLDALLREHAASSPERELPSRPITDGADSC